MNGLERLNPITTPRARSRVLRRAAFTDGAAGALLDATGVNNGARLSIAARVG